MNTKPILAITADQFTACEPAIRRAVINTVRSVGQEHRADEIITDSISHAWERGLPSYDGSGSLEGYLVFIAKNYALNQCRTHGRKDNLTNSTSAPVSEESDMADQSAETKAFAGVPDVQDAMCLALDRSGMETELADKMAAMDSEKRECARRLIAGERATDIADDMGKGKHWVSRVRTELVGPKPTKAPKVRKLPKLTPK